MSGRRFSRFTERPQISAPGVVIVDCAFRKASRFAYSPGVSREEVIDTILAFLKHIGIDTFQGSIVRPTLVPGVDICNGMIVIDAAAIGAPADALHEAAHVALTAPDARQLLDGTIESSPAEELSAIAWTWAAAMHLQLDPREVFHEEVISGNGPTLLENFTSGRYVGVPMLQRWGLTFDERQARERGTEPYPHMQRWLR
jgi:hypothetical protein